jgi:hypothetical protein
MGPVWDFDMSLGNCNYGGCDTPDGDYVSQTWYYSHLFGMPEFRALAKKIWSEKYEAILGMKDYTVKTAQMLEKSLTLNFRVWNILGHGVGSNPKNIAEAETYSEQIDIMLDFFDRRINFVGSYIDSLK